MNSTTSDLAERIAAINTAWTSGASAQLCQYFHEDMIIVGPDATKMGSGKEECIRSYQDFMDNAHVARFAAREPDIEIWGNTALAYYEFEILYRMNGKEYYETGRDIFTFTRASESDPWLAVWRMLIPIEAHSE